MYRLVLTLGSALLASCTSVPAPDVTRFLEPEGITLHGTAPALARPGTCWSQIQKPSVITSVTAQILTANTRQIAQPNTMREDGIVWFERPCEAEMTPNFIESLQRALAVRGLYRREITGQMDAATLFAVRLYQQPLGLDSAVLSLTASRALGLSVIELNAYEQAQLVQGIQTPLGAVFLPEEGALSEGMLKPVPRP